MLALSSGGFRFRGGLGEEDLFLILSAMADGDREEEWLRVWPRAEPDLADVGIADEEFIESIVLCRCVPEDVEKPEARGKAGGVGSLSDFLNNLPRIWFRLGAIAAG